MGWREHRFAPNPGTVLCRVEDIPAGSCREVCFGDAGDRLSILVCRGEFGVRAFDNKCPHFSLPLNAKPEHFLLMPNGRIMCAFHCAVFRLDDGQCVAGPAVGMGLDRVPVHLIDGRVTVGAQ